LKRQAKPAAAGAVSNPAPPVSGFVFANPPDAVDPLNPIRPDDYSDFHLNLGNQFAGNGG
jgi:hypothetical protein